METSAHDCRRKRSAARERTEGQPGAALGRCEASCEAGGTGFVSRRDRTGVVLCSRTDAAGAEKAWPARRKFAAVAQEDAAPSWKTWMKAPFFTGLIDSYNYGPNVEEAVSGALAQEFSPGQRGVFVVDERLTGSTEGRVVKLP